MKPSGRVWQPIVLLTILTLCCFAITGCNSKPTDPAPTEPTDYIAYFADLNSDNWVFGYHILSGQLDSFQVPALPVNTTNHWQLLKPKLVVSADGSELYIGLEDSVLKCDIDNPLDAEIIHVAAGGGLAVSSDGNYFSAFGRDGVYIFHTSDNSLVFHDTDHVLQGGFTADNERFYATVFGSYAYQVSFLDSSQAERVQLTSWFLGQAIPDDNEGRWFMLTNNERCTAAIEEFDVSTNATMRRDTFGGWGEVEVAPDGRFVVYTHPAVGIISLCDPRPVSLSVYDGLTNSVQTVDIVLNPDDTAGGIQDYPYLNMRDVEITPDGRWIVTTSGGLLAVVDVSTFEVRNYIHLHGKRFHYLTIQNSL